MMPDGKFSDDQIEAMNRFMDQAAGSARRRFPHGRIGPNDEGDLAIAIAADKRHGVVLIQFPEPVQWIGLHAESCRTLIAKLTEKLTELEGGK